jgi:hypothetical protein
MARRTSMWVSLALLGGALALRTPAADAWSDTSHLRGPQRQGTLRRNLGPGDDDVRDFRDAPGFRDVVGATA